MSDTRVGPEQQDLSTEAVANTRPSAKKAAKRPKNKVKAKKAANTSTGAKGLPWTFPKHSLDDSIRIAKAIEDKNAGNPMPASDVAIAVGYRQSQDWRFLELLRSANQYGLVDGTGPGARISLSKLGQDIVAPSSPKQRTDGLLSAFRHVKDFSDVEKFYGDKAIPEDEFFLNTLTREFNIPRDRAEVFAKVFTVNLAYLRAFAVGARDSTSELTATHDSSKSIKVIEAVPHNFADVRGREYLETCFVMMPFGSWFDRYYQDIYVPAIKDAGFEPVRADELFSTGSVVEQIWEQISKAKILLADLSGKNPNVFYELGLAHAAIKPVVFTASKVDDVPFDLRHLRVIVYEIEDPDWGAKLRKGVTEYLRNAARDPDKSIPHPFRGLVDETHKNLKSV